MAESTLATAKDAAGLWAAMVAEAGLRPVRRRDGSENYDTALEAGLRSDLELGTGPMSRELARSRVTVEALLVAVLSGLRPWAAMLQGILEMLEEAQAAHAGQTIELSVQWSKLPADLQASLQTFRRWSAQVGEVIDRAGGPRWGELNLWDARLRPGQEPPLETLPPEFRSWVAGYRDEVRSDPPRPAPTGHKAFDLEVLRLHQAVRSHIRAARRLAPTRQERMQRSLSDRTAGVWRDYGEGWTAPRLASVDHDMLADRALLAAVAAPITAGWDESSADAYAERIRQVLDEVPVVPSDPPSTLKALTDILDLPVWRQRHELYSVWIAAVIRSAAPQQWKWLTSGEVLSFAFAGSELATIDLDEFEGVFWAELSRRAVLTRSIVRKSTVKPDYTLLLAADRKTAKAGLVVECKQYRKPSRRNFTAALTDYAEAHPYAAVALANYGRVGGAAAEGLSDNRCAPVAAFGEVYPGGIGLSPFRHFLREAFEALGGLAKILDQPKKEVHVAYISISWETGGDLDLHVAARDGHWPRTRVGYGPEDARARNYMRWSGDRQTAPASEQVEIQLPFDNAYEIYVHLYAGSWPDGGAQIRVGCGRLQVDVKSPSAVDAWWHVGTLRPASDLFEPGRGMLDQAPW